MSELTPEEKRHIYEEEKVRLAAQEKLKNEKSTKQVRTGCMVIIVIVASIFIYSLLTPNKSSKSHENAPTLSQQDKSQILTALNNKGYPAPMSMEINDSGWLVAMFELTDPRSAAYLEKFATESLLTIRNTMQPNSIVSKYRVTLNGSSPGPGLILRFGNARFIEGGGLRWEPAKR